MVLNWPIKLKHLAGLPHARALLAIGIEHLNRANSE
jgi:hypothetical protein